MRRREFITLLGSAITVTSLSWPLTARAQQVGRRLLPAPDMEGRPTSR